MTRTGKIFIIAACAGLAVLAALVAVLFNKETDARRRRAAATYEATAAQHLKNLAAAEQNHLEVFGDYATLRRLVEAGIVLNEEFAREPAVVDGYVYTLRLTPRAGDRPPSYSINADPQPPPGSYGGRLHFYLDSEVSGIRFNDQRPATATDRQRE
jgi:hypothetical protein